MQEVLIVRSVGFQQLDNNLPKIKEKFPNSRLSILTHEHGVKLAEKYGDIDRIYSYPYKKGFSFWRRVPALKGRKFHAIVVPVGNLSGLGFSNVLFYALSLAGKTRWMCNLVSEIGELSRLEIVANVLKNTLFKTISWILTGLLAIGWLVVLPVILWRIKTRNGESRHV